MCNVVVGIPEDKHSEFTQKQIRELTFRIRKQFKEMMEERDYIGYQVE